MGCSHVAKGYQCDECQKFAPSTYHAPVGDWAVPAGWVHLGVEASGPMIDRERVLLCSWQCVGAFAAAMVRIEPIQAVDAV